MRAAAAVDIFVTRPPLSRQAVSLGREAHIVERIEEKMRADIGRIVSFLRRRIAADLRLGPHGNPACGNAGITQSRHFPAEKNLAVELRSAPARNRLPAFRAVDVVGLTLKGNARLNEKRQCGSERLIEL